MQNLKLQCYCNLKANDINVKNKYGYEIKCLDQITSNFELELGIIMKHSCSKF